MNYSPRQTSLQTSSEKRFFRSFLHRHGPALAGAAALLAGSAAYVQYKTRKTEQDNPPSGKWVDVDGVRLHYIERGQGQPVVLLHGNGTMAKELDVSGVLDLASQTYRVIAFDRPGYGYSDRPRSALWNPFQQAELLHRALERLGIEKPVVVGHSWGTMVAVALALAYPGDVKSLLLMSGYYYPTPRLDVPLSSPTALPVLGDLLRHTVSPLLGRLIWPVMVRKLFAPAGTPARFKDEYPVWMSMRPGQLRATTEEIAMMIPFATQLSRRYRELDVPTVIMAGEADLHVIPDLHSKRLHRELPHSELILLPGVGHMIQHTAPAEVLWAIDLAVGHRETIHHGERSQMTGNYVTT